MSTLTISEEIKSLELLADEIHEEMSSESPSTEEWLSRAERFIVIQRKINWLHNEMENSTSQSSEK
jgi:hypothetical protein